METKSPSEDVQALAAKIHARLEVEANPERRRVAATYTPTAMEVLGVTVPHIRSVAQDECDSLEKAVPGGEEPGDLPKLLFSNVWGLSVEEFRRFDTSGH